MVSLTPPFPLLSVITSEITGGDGTTATQPRSASRPASTRRQGKVSTQSSSSSSSRPPPPSQPRSNPSRPPQHRHQSSQLSPRPPGRSTNTQSHLGQFANLLVLPPQPPTVHHLPPMVNAPPSPISDSPTLSSVSDSPTLSPVVDGVLPPPFDHARLPSPIPNLAEFYHFVQVDVAPAGLIPSIRQDRATGYNDEWFYVVRGRTVGIFNNQ